MFPSLLLAIGIVTNLAVLAQNDRPDVRFDITAIVTSPSARFGETLAIESDDSAMTLSNESTDPHVQAAAGDLVRVRGRSAIASNGSIRHNITHLEVLGKGPAPEPHQTTIREMSDGVMDGRLVRFRCTLRDIHLDEIDTGFIYLALADDGDSVYSACSRTDENEQRFKSLIGTKVEVVGVCSFSKDGYRLIGGRCVSLRTNDGFRVIGGEKEDPFDLPGVSELNELQPARIAQHSRCRAIGTVIAVWCNGTRALLQDNGGTLIGLELAEGESPRSQTVIEAIGLPASNLFHINLLRARWRPALGAPRKPETVVRASAAELLTDGLGKSRFASQCHGHAISLVGTIKAISTPESHEGRVYLESEGFVIPVDVSAIASPVDGLEVGAGAIVSGVCIMEGDNWTPYTAFPQIHGMTLVIRSPTDICITSSPPWWTPMRLFAVIGGLGLFLVSVFIWNLLLRNSVTRREQALKQEIFAHVNSNAKIRERTRLAVELHDSLSQGLTGVSLEIDAAVRMKDDPKNFSTHLAYAAKSLMSCRDELKNCIWDLRNDTLDSQDMTDAIRRTLTPVLADATLSLRFPIARKRLTDKQTHTILRVLRELVTNAIRHGHAHSIRIAGSEDGKNVYCSVRDDGCGFDPGNRPSVAEGHFGLQGVRERIKEFNGDLDISSSSGHGCRVEFSLTLSDDEEDRPA